MCEEGHYGGGCVCVCMVPVCVHGGPDVCVHTADVCVHGPDLCVCFSVITDSSRAPVHLNIN